MLFIILKNVDWHSEQINKQTFVFIILYYLLDKYYRSILLSMSDKIWNGKFNLIL